MSRYNLRSKDAKDKDDSIDDEHNDSQSDQSTGGEEQIYKKSKLSKNSPYSKLNDELEQLKTDQNLRKRSRRDQEQNAKTSRSRSSSRTRISSRTRSEIGDSREPKLKEPRLKEQLFKNRPKSSSTSSSNFTFILLSLLLIGIVIALCIYKPNYIPKSVLTTLINPILQFLSIKERGPTYIDIINRYKSNLPGISRIIVETAVEKFESYEDEQNARPVVLMLYGQNETKIKTFYRELAQTLIKPEKNGHNEIPIVPVESLFLEHDRIVENLKNKEIVLFDGLENLKGKDYKELYAFVDEDDAIVKKCLIVISLHSDEIKKVKIDLNDTQEMESHVKGQLKKLWNEIEINNLEAFFNRIISFVSFVH